MTRFLLRIGAADDAPALHHALIAAGRASPLAPGDVASGAEEVSDALGGAGAVAQGRASLVKHG